MVGFCALALALAFSGLAVMAFWAGQASRGCWAGGGGGGERYYDGKYARDCCIAESTGLDNSRPLRPWPQVGPVGLGLR